MKTTGMYDFMQDHGGISAVFKVPPEVRQKLYEGVAPPRKKMDVQPGFFVSKTMGFLILEAEKLARWKIFFPQNIFGNTPPQMVRVPTDLNIGETRVWRLDSGPNLQPWKDMKTKTCSIFEIDPHMFGSLLCGFFFDLTLIPWNIMLRSRGIITATVL